MKSPEVILANHLQMEEVRNFLEFSTIHGLTHVASSRKLVKAFWILVVIAGFTGASVIIYQSFDNWADSPVKTTLETHTTNIRNHISQNYCVSTKGYIYRPEL